MVTNDPHRTPAVVETDEQRCQRLYNEYWALGAINVVGQSRETLAKIDARRDVLMQQMTDMHVKSHGYGDGSIRSLLEAFGWEAAW